MNVAVAPALQPRKRAPDPVSGCSRANASAIQAPAPLAKKPRRSHAWIELSGDEPLHREPRRSRARIESSDDEPLHEEYYASVHEKSIEPRREQPTLANGLASLPMKRFPGNLATLSSTCWSCRGMRVLHFLPSLLDLSRTMDISTTGELHSRARRRGVSLPDALAPPLGCQSSYTT